MADHVYKLREVPKGERLKFFWDYYRYYTLAAVIGVIAVVSFLTTVVFAPKCDMAIISATEIYVPSEVWTAAEESLEAMPFDLNEDGKVLIDVNDNYLPPEMSESDPETFIAMQTKLMASLSTAESALQIVDEGFMSYFREQGLLGTYKELPDAKGHGMDEEIAIPLKELAPFKDIEGLPDGLFMTLRPLDAMQILGSEKKFDNYQRQIEALLVMMQS